MNLPTEEECLQYFNEYHVPSNIKKHCVKVREIAVFLAKKLQEVGIDINLELVSRSALLHDLFKVVVLEELTPSGQYHPEDYTDDEIAMWKHLREKYPGLYESEVAYEIFKDEFPELALTVKNSSNPRKKDKSWEELVVHYSDWRISGEKVILLRERLDYLKERYPREDDGWEMYEHVIKKDEAKVFEQLPFSPDKLAEKLSQESNKKISLENENGNGN